MKFLAFWLKYFFLIIDRLFRVNWIGNISLYLCKKIYPNISTNKYIPISRQTNISLCLCKQIYPYISANKYIPIPLQTNISLYLCKQIYPYTSANKYIPMSLQTNISLYLYEENLLKNFLSLILADVWFTKNRLGGSQFPPLYFLLLIQIYNIWYIFEKPLGSTSIVLRKKCKFEKILLFIAKSRY